MASLILLDEEHYLRSAEKLLDAEASVLQEQIGRMPEPRMLLMSALMLADKTAALQEKLTDAEKLLADTRVELEQLKNAPAPEAKKVEVPIIPPQVGDSLADIAVRVPKVWHNAWKTHNQTCRYFQQFETERLLVAHWAETIAVLEARRRLAMQLPDLLTPDVVAHLPPYFDLTDQNMDEWIEACDAEIEIYLMREKGTDALIGLKFLTPSIY